MELKTKIIPHNTTQIIPLVVSLEGKTDNNKSIPTDLIVVIDISSSMEGEKLKTVKGTFRYLLEYLSDNDRLAIVIFNSGAARILPLIRMTVEGKFKVLEAVNKITAFGCTDICVGLCHAFHILKCRIYINAVSSIYLLSDGLDQGANPKIQKELLNFDIKDTFSIHAFGFGKDHDPVLMASIADTKDGNFFFIEKLD
jgi:Mg-chelatase subunit ChlD